jgi:hypothetical protein
LRTNKEITAVNQNYFELRCSFELLAALRTALRIMELDRGVAAVFRSGTVVSRGLSVSLLLEHQRVGSG